jgi:hypothetical protein
MWIVGFLFAAIIATGFVALGAYMVYHVSRESEREDNLRRLWTWIGKGFVLPMILWGLMNIGLAWWLQPFMPSVQAAQASVGGFWFGDFLRVMAGGIIIVSTYWLAVTLGWTMFQISRGLEKEVWSNFRALCLTSLAGMALPSGFLIFVGGWHMLGLALSSVMLPILGYSPSVLNRVKRKPMYSAAIARMKFGKYAQAEKEIIRQLENAENDFDGWMMLAELYANQFNDLNEAEQMIVEICDQPKVTPSQLSIALHKLADWHLKIGSDPDAARRALQVITLRLPGSHLARMAELRSRQIPNTVEELREQGVARPVPMPGLSDNLGEATGTETVGDTKQAAKTANQLIERLTRDPNDVFTRERLARIMVEQLGKVDGGIEQIELLLGMADQPDVKRADWLGLIAAWYLKFKQNELMARGYMERLIREYPGYPQALAAQRRINLMTAEKRQAELRSARPTIRIEPD